MTRKGKIISFMDPREVISKQTGEVYYFTPVEIRWYEEVPNSEPQLCTLVAEVKGKIDTAKVNKLIASETPVALRIYFDTRSFLDQETNKTRKFNQIKLFLDKDLMEETF